MFWPAHTILVCQQIAPLGTLECYISLKEGMTW
jgi:hypothetical protein